MPLEESKDDAKRLSQELDIKQSKELDFSLSSGGGQQCPYVPAVTHETPQHTIDARIKCTLFEKYHRNKQHTPCPTDAPAGTRRWRPCR